ncbi:MAG: 16S rRNA (uracil(1498)-N(3))-methyltransferase [Treponema sp.]|nr:16S rRNA (uracil(1498)-N(3))-methyltransferase [Treponema sp.]
MKQFILKAGPDRNGRLRLEGDDYRYLVRVRRLAPGEYFPALLPGGGTVTVRVLSVDNRALTGEISRSDSAQSESASPALPPVILLQALPKSGKMDLIVRQAAEGGAAEIVPFVSEFSITKIGKPVADGEKLQDSQRLTRWRRIIREARQQSGSAAATEICQPVPMDGLFAYWEQIKTKWPGAVGLLFHHQPLANESLHGYLDRYPDAVAIAVGPEGGFSPAEAERFIAAGFRPFTLGNSVLRTETAALFAQAAVRILLAERDSWETKQKAKN